jgi:RNA polymerase sigma-32 factor
MKAVKRFDPEQGVRLVSYALHWIKAEIHEYILKNWRMVKVATTKAQRKLFFNLRSMKQGLKEDAGEGQTHRSTLTPAEVATVARELNVKPEEVVEMETRLTGGDVALEPQTDDGEESFARSPTWPTTAANRRAGWKPATATGSAATASAARWPRWTSAAAAWSRSAG